MIMSKNPGYFAFMTLDIQMPEMDGITCARLIRSYEKHNRKEQIPIVFISGNSSEQERVQCVDFDGDIKADFFYRKPVTFAQCQHFAQAILNREAPLRLLVVDDDPFNSFIVRQFLEREKIECDVARNGIEAMNMVTREKRQFDCILMDYEMPGLDGIGVTSQIKTFLHRHGKNNVMIIGVTCFGEEEKIKKGLSAGMARVFSKPVDFGELIGYIKKNVSNH